MPIRGTVKLSANEFVYDKFTMRPVYADIIFSPESITAHIKKAVLCNINVQGYVEMAGSNQKMELTLAAKDQDLGGAIACLSEGASVMTGRFNLDGKLSMSPLQTDQPLKGLAGTFSFRAWDGRIIKYVPLAGIFSLLTATEYFRGLPDLRKEGLSYSTFTISGNIHQGILSLKEATIDSPAMLIMAEGIADLADSKVDIITLVAPFKTIDSMIKILPRRKEDNLASLVSIGVRMKGDIHNPNFSVQPLSGMSRGLTGVMERMLKAPVRIIELINPLPEK